MALIAAIILILFLAEQGFEEWVSEKYRDFEEETESDYRSKGYSKLHHLSPNFGYTRIFLKRHKGGGWENDICVFWERLQDGRIICYGDDGMIVADITDRVARYNARKINVEPTRTIKDYENEARKREKEERNSKPHISDFR